MDNQKIKLSQQISDELLSQCIHCGICLSVCPTYEITKLERSSPRGRIRLIKTFAENKEFLGKLFEEEMSFCLGCRACETACPAGVRYDILHINTKDALNRKVKINFQKIILKIFLNRILAHPRKLKFYSRLLSYYQKSRLRKFLHEKYLLKIISEKLFLLDELSPKMSKIPSDELIEEVTLPNGKTKYNVGFHVGCIMNVAFAETNLDTVNLLKKLSCKIRTPKNQNCCGALQAHNGELNTAKELAKQNIDLFKDCDYQYLISNSAGCGAFMKEYRELLKDDVEYSYKAKEFSNKVKDITEFIYENDIKLNFKSNGNKITYHDACHHVHGQDIYKQPRKIISEINETNFIELNESAACCGSAGIYNLLRQEDSLVFLERKMENIIKTGADFILTGNPGCLLQLKYGVKKNGLNLDVKHTVNYLNEVLEE